MATPNLTSVDFPGSLVTFPEQLQSDIEGPVVFFNIFVLSSTLEEEDFLASWTVDGQWMKSQPGLIQGQLHRAIDAQSGRNNVFVNVAVWEDIAAFKTAIGDPNFRKTLESYPEGTKMYPLLTKKFAVPGVCVN